MATKARGGFGAKLYREDVPGGGSFSPITEVTDINGPSLTHQTQDVTNMDSPNGWVEKIPLLIKEAGDVTFETNLIDNDASQANMLSDFKSGTVRNWRLVYPSGTRRVSFAAMVGNISQTIPVKGAMKRPITLTITSEPVFEANP